MPNTTLSIVVEDQERFSEIIENCKKAGLQVEQQMDAVGVITGSIDSEKIGDLKKIAGVHIEQSRQIGIAPPDSEIQ